MKFFSCFVCVLAVLCLISYPVASWSCPNKGAVQGSDLFPNFFTEGCLKDYSGKCHVTDSFQGAFERESDVPAPCAETGDFLMFCSSFFANIIKDDTTASMGFVDNNQQVTGFTSGRYNRFCVPTNPCGNDDTSRFLFLGLDKVDGKIAISEYDTVVSRTKVLPFSRKDIPDTKLGKLIPAETLTKDGTYTYSFHLRKMESEEEFYRAVGRIEAMNASLHIKNSFFVPANTLKIGP